MKSCHHHPGAELLLHYASGQLSGLQRLMVKLHLKACSTCEAVVNEAEALGGSSLEQMPDTALSENAFEQVMARIHQSEMHVKHDTNKPDFDKLIEDIFTKGNSDGLNWQWRTKRFAEIILPVNDESYEAKLIYFKKGMKVPRHTHRDKEMTLVLKGAFSDDSGIYQKGDYVCKTTEHEHAPVAESDCICLAITTQPLKFTGTFGPVLNWFLN